MVLNYLTKIICSIIKISYFEQERKGEEGQEKKEGQKRNS